MQYRFPQFERMGIEYKIIVIRITITTNTGWKISLIFMSLRIEQTNVRRTLHLRETKKKKPHDNIRISGKEIK